MVWSSVRQGILYGCNSQWTKQTSENIEQSPETLFYDLSIKWDLLLSGEWGPVTLVRVLEWVHGQCPLQEHYLSEKLRLKKLILLSLKWLNNNHIKNLQESHIFIWGNTQFPKTVCILAHTNTEVNTVTFGRVGESFWQRHGWISRVLGEFQGC